MARYEEVQAAQIREGEHRGAANRLRTEHKEVGSGPGAGSAEVGADGGPTPAGSGESFPASFDRIVAFFRRSKGVFQQAVQLRPLRTSDNPGEGLHKEPIPAVRSASSH